FAPVTMGYLRQSSEQTRAGIRLCNQAAEEFNFDGVRTDQEEFLKLCREFGLRKLSAEEAGPAAELSGGEKTKLALAEVLAAHPDFLLLDEPTNHLDLFGVEWLIQRLTAYEGTVVIISHDRYFLDRTVTNIWELEEGKLRHYPGNYTDYRRKKRQDYEGRLAQYYIEKKRQEKIEREIARLKQWSAKAHREAGKSGGVRIGNKEFYRTKAKKMDNRVKSQIKKLNRLKEHGTPKPKAEKQVDFAFTEAGKHSRRILEVRDLQKGFHGRILFTETTFFIKRGDKVGLFGPNGCGKTTLFRILRGDLSPDHGEIWLSPSVKTGYLSQDVHDFATSKNVWEFLGLAPRFFNEEAKQILLNMGFTYDSLYRPVSVLSTGEKTRLKIARLILEHCELLFMDEPTNHLDLFQREQLEEALAAFDGTLLMASHDRYMLERICHRLLVFVEQDGVSTVRMVEGGFGAAQELLHGRTLENEWKTKPPASSAEGLSRKELEEELILMENRMSALLGELSLLVPGTPEYGEADAEFQKLIARKQEMKKELSSAE
ncbi:MAG TPA: ABC-F family ATP-binding cassette domain-containing protein, partial [Bacillota bacterium]